MENKLAFVVAMMAATYPVRLLPLLALSDRRLPDLVVRWMRYVPPAVFGALVFPAVLLRDGSPAVAASNPFLWAAVATFVTAMASRSIFKSVTAGVLVALLGRALLG